MFLHILYSASTQFWDTWLFTALQYFSYTLRSKICMSRKWDQFCWPVGTIAPLLYQHKCRTKLRLCNQRKVSPFGYQNRKCIENGLHIRSGQFRLATNTPVKWKHGYQQYGWSTLQIYVSAIIIRRCRLPVSAFALYLFNIYSPCCWP